jgi:hypothetical protein
MAKRKNETKLKESYIEVVRRYNIDTIKSYKRQVREMIMIAERIQSQICNHADDIKITNFRKVVTQVDPNLDASTWKDCVNLNARKDSIKQKTREKYIEKTRNQIKAEMYKSMQLGKGMDIHSEIFIPTDNISCSAAETKNSIYEELLNESTKTRTYINNVLYTEYNMLSEAAEYISEGDVTKDRFKTLVDYEHYLGGYPSEHTPAKIDSTILKFLELYYLTKKYDPEFFDEHFNPLIKHYSNMFELKENRIKPTEIADIKC